MNGKGKGVLMCGDDGVSQFVNVADVLLLIST